jgi:anti-sigma factor RsiW
MSRCLESRRVQEYLDLELTPERARALEAHLAQCDRCTAEMTAYRALFANLDKALDRVEALDPGPALTERILDRVLPSRLRRRWVTAAGWVYGTFSALITFLFASWITRPETHVWLAGTYTEASLRVAQTALFTIQALVGSWLELSQGWGLVERLVGRTIPWARAVAQPLSDPLVVAVGLAALAACSGLLWWMRSGRHAVTEEIRNVGLLGL